MPASPKICYRDCKVRRIEILHQPEAHDLRRANRNVGIASKITIYLKRKQHSRCKKLEACPLRVRIVYTVHGNRQILRKYDLLKESVQHQQKSVSDAFKFKPMLFI